MRNEDLVSFKNFCNDHGIDFMIGGSLALKVCGVELGRDVSDIDVEVVLKDASQVVLFDALTAASPLDASEFKQAYSQVEESPYIFVFGETIFNVWVKKKFTHEVFVWKDYIKYAGVMSVLKEKMRYQRVKDYKDMTFLINKLSNLA